MPLLILVSLLWAFSFGLIKHFLGGVDSAFVAAVRLALSLAVFLPFWRPRVPIGRAVLGLVVIGAIQFGLMYLAYLAAFHSLAAYQIALLTIVTPIFVCLWDDVLERRWRWQPWLAAAVAVGGAALILAKQTFGRAEWTSVLLLQGSNLCFALGQVLYRRWKGQHRNVRDRDVFAWLYLGAGLVTVPFACLHLSAASFALTAPQLAVLFYLGVLASGLGFFLWNLGATRVTTGALAAMNNAKTPLGVAASLLVFGEQTDLPRLLVGGGLILAAAWFAERFTR